MQVHDLIENHDGSMQAIILLDIIIHEMLQIIGLKVLFLIEMLDVLRFIGM
jgi:hypothetical protein